jgi:hypothetical protein
MLVFGAAQLFLSFIPDFHDMAWLSVVAAVMSFSYAFIGLGLGLSTTICKTLPLSLYCLFPLEFGHLRFRSSIKTNESLMLTLGKLTNLFLFFS